MKGMFVTITSKWGQPAIYHWVDDEGISISIPLESFVDAVKQEMGPIADDFASALKSEIGSVALTFRKEAFGAQFDEAVKNVLAQKDYSESLNAAIRAVIKGVKREAVKVIR